MTRDAGDISLLESAANAGAKQQKLAIAARQIRNIGFLRLGHEAPDRVSRHEGIMALRIGTADERWLVLGLNDGKTPTLVSD
jgi:hypothetical protein